MSVKSVRAGNLGNYTTGIDVALENLGIASKGIDALRNACAARVVKTNDGSTLLHGQVHNLAHLPCHCLAKRATYHGEVLCEDIY